MGIGILGFAEGWQVYQVIKPIAVAPGILIQQYAPVLAFGRCCDEKVIVVKMYGKVFIEKVLFGLSR